MDYIHLCPPLSLYIIFIYNYIGVLQLKILCLEKIRREGLEEQLHTCPHWAKNQYMDFINSQFYHLS